VLEEIYNSVPTHNTIHQGTIYFDVIYDSVQDIYGTTLTNSSEQNTIDNQIEVINTALNIIPAFVTKANEILANNDLSVNLQILNQFNAQVTAFNT
jgi:hypothetical protein